MKTFPLTNNPRLAYLLAFDKTRPADIAAGLLFIDDKGKERRISRQNKPSPPYERSTISTH
jgi:hypothetical protein